MASLPFKDRPVHLVDIKDDGMFEITSEGISFLSSLKTQKVLIPYQAYTYIHIGSSSFNYRSLS